jgi:hypothetical protein
MRKYIQVVQAGGRWADISGNNRYRNPGRILVSTTDPSDSGSGQTFLMILSYIFNGDRPVTDTATADRLLHKIVPFYEGQGDMQIHPPSLFNQFLLGGMGLYPMIFGYEGDYLALAVDKSQRQKLPSDLVVMYPNPTALSEDAFVSWTKAGDKLNNLLSDPAIINVEMKYGQRTRANVAEFVQDMKADGITVPANPPK